MLTRMIQDLRDGFTKYLEEDAERFYKPVAEKAKAVDEKSKANDKKKKIGVR